MIKPIPSGLKVQTLTATGTWYKPGHVTGVWYRMNGPGGGGGGGDSDDDFAGGGGGGGEVKEGYMAVVGNITFTQGAIGTGGAQDADGTDAGNSTISDGTTTITAYGGKKGLKAAGADGEAGVGGGAYITMPAATSIVGSGSAGGCGGGKGGKSGFNYLESDSAAPCFGYGKGGTSAATAGGGGGGSLGPGGNGAAGAAGGDGTLGGGGAGGGDHGNFAGGDGGISQVTLMWVE